MKKTTIAIACLALIISFTSCKKETKDSSNLKISGSIPSSGFYAENKIIYTITNIPNTSIVLKDSSTNGGTISLKLNTGTYIVYAYAPSSNISYDAISDHYQTSSGSYGQEVQVTGNDVSTLTFNKWCQYRKNGPIYCN